MQALGQDLRFGLRILVKKRAITAIAVITLALGISANTAIFSVAFAAILRPLPFDRQEQLFVAWKSDATANNPFVELSVPVFNDWQKQSQLVEHIAAMPTTAYGYGYVLTGQGDPVQVESGRVSADFFATLGARPLLGRDFRIDDDRPGAAPVVVLSHQLWQELFSGDPDIVGRTITLGQTGYSVIGVMPARFEFPKGVSVWTSLSATMPKRTIENRGAVFLQAIGRLKPGVTISQAEAELNTIIGLQAAEHPETEALGHRVVITPLAEYVFGDARPALWLLLVATGLLLLIACVNVANLLLARALSRRRELAVRAALGASRARLVRQFLTESMLLTVFSGALGISLSYWLIDLLLWVAPADIPRLGEVHINGMVLLFTCVVTLLCTLVVGLAPALASSKVNLNESLNEGGSRISGERGGGRLRSALVVVEVAMSLLLLVGAGLTVRSFQNLSRVNLGFDPHNVLTFQLSLQGEKYRDRGARREFFRQLLDRLEEQPGVAAAGAVLIRPLEGTIGWDVPFALEGQPLAEARKNPVPNFETISPHYFRALGIPLKTGREFTEQDNEQTPYVAIISESMARGVFGPDVDPIGKRITDDPGETDARWRTIVGVAADARYRELKDIRWDLYVPYRQSTAPIRYIAVRTNSDPVAFVSAARHTVASMDPTQALSGVMTMEQLVDGNLSRSRFISLLLVSLAMLGALLAAVGIYGVISCAVTQRTQEIGVRMALGAQPRDVLRLVIGQGMRLALTGVATGLMSALALTRLMTSLLYGVGASDAVTFGLTAVLLAGVALLACYLPARRATKVDPMVALRYE
ncbi:MAG TPA: ABC transporter permease [Blastocatellia bacterium]|nr:ABC transporter permease [Blastocatellia bacterium]